MRWVSGTKKPAPRKMAEAVLASAVDCASNRGLSSGRSRAAGPKRMRHLRYRRSAQRQAPSLRIRRRIVVAERSALPPDRILCEPDIPDCVLFVAQVAPAIGLRLVLELGQ